jgi:hypothetical protein
MMSTLIFLLMQADYKQTEYPKAYLLLAAMILLGVVAVCVPRHRTRHFVEPKIEEKASSQQGARQRPAVKR